MAHNVLINGEWISSTGTSTFQAVNPATEQPIEGDYPVSPWGEVEAALDAAAEASRLMRGWSGERFAAFLERYADRIEARTDELVEMASQETALPAEGRLKGVELPRTTYQLRLAAAAAREGSWAAATIDTAPGIRSIYGPIGPVLVSPDLLDDIDRGDRTVFVAEQVGRAEGIRQFVGGRDVVDELVVVAACGGEQHEADEHGETTKRGAHMAPEGTGQRRSTRSTVSG